MLALMLATLTTLPLALRFGARFEEWVRVLLHLEYVAIVTIKQTSAWDTYSRPAGLVCGTPMRSSSLVARSGRCLARTSVLCRFPSTGTDRGRLVVLVPNFRHSATANDECATAMAVDVCVRYAPRARCWRSCWSPSWWTCATLSQREAGVGTRDVKKTISTTLLQLSNLLVKSH